jgi:hypothetical protein
MNPVAKLLTSIFQSPAQREQRAAIESLQKEHKRAVRRLEEMYDDALSDWQRELDEIRGNSLAGRAGARKDGDSWPLLVNMEDLNRYRAESREVCDGNGYGAGMLDRAIDFVIGDGMQPEVTLRGAKKGAVSTGVADADGDGRPDADAAVVNVQAVIDEFRRLNDWGMGDEDREEEGFRRSQRDAEVGVRFFAGGAKTNGIPRVRWFEPEQLDTPPSALPNERWGIRTDKDDVEDKQAYYLKRIDGTGGEWVDAGEICWHKLGTDRTVLRGMPQFWLVAKALRQAEALNSAVAEVSAIQARIAYVREHAAGVMPGQITDFVGGQGDATTRKRTPYGDSYRRVGITEEGTTVDMSSGMKFTAGPVSQGVPAFVQALQSRLRQVCARFGYPEFFTGDASNGNYASLLAAGGPAERAFKRRQMKYAAFQACVYRKACEYAVQAGRLSAADLAAVDIKVKPGGVAVSNKLEEAQVQQIRIQNKILSPQTAMMQNGEDPRLEAANIEAWDAKFGMGAMGLGGGQAAQLLELSGGLGESYTQDEYELLTEAQRGLLVKQSGVDSLGRPYTRWVSAGGDVGGKADASVQRARMVKPGGETADDAKAKPDAPKSAKSEKPKQAAKTRDQLDYLPKDPKRLTVDQAVQALTDLGYSDVEWGTDAMTATAPDGKAVSLPHAQVKRVLYGDAAVPKASRMNLTDLSRAFAQAGGGRILGPATGEPVAKPKAFRVRGADGNELVVAAGDILSAVVRAGLAREQYREDQYELLTEADRAGLVKRAGVDAAGRRYTRWVRVDQDGPMSGDDKKRAKAAAEVEKQVKAERKSVMHKAERDFDRQLSPEVDALQRTQDKRWSDEQLELQDDFDTQQAIRDEDRAKADDDKQAARDRQDAEHEAKIEKYVASRTAAIRTLPEQEREAETERLNQWADSQRDKHAAEMKAARKAEDDSVKAERRREDQEAKAAHRQKVATASKEDDARSRAEMNELKANHRERWNQFYADYRAETDRLAAERIKQFVGSGE